MKALITGIAGQDAAYLSKLLIEKGYEVVGGARRNASGSLWRLDKLGIREKVRVLDMELTEFSNVFNLIKTEMPGEIYNLGAMSFVGASFADPIYTMQANCVGLLNILESVRVLDPTVKVYQASTSEMFGKVQETPQNENTKFYPRSPYGVAKVAAHYTAVNYREAYNMFVCNGILFNHESPLRGSEFVTKKIVEYAVKYKLCLTTEPLKLGNLDARRDWGFAGDYVEAMYLMMQQEKPDDFVIATGVTHSIREFIFEVERLLSTILPVVVDEKFLRPADVEVLQGNPTKAEVLLDWTPKTTFKELVKLMVESELSCYDAD